MRRVVMNESRSALALVAALLTLWGAPVAAQPSETPAASASKKSKKQPAGKKPPATSRKPLAKKGTHGKPPAGTTSEDIP